MQIPLLSLSSIWAMYFARTAPIVDLGYARYQGSMNKATGNIEFLGVPYAATPTGTLRWREPQPPEVTAGIKIADTQPYTCWLAGPNKPGSPPPSEDCLFLNIVAPPSGKKGLPVVVWFHGGGYFTGSAFMYNGNDLMLQAGSEAVVVVIQYRLGVFGFLGGQGVHDRGTLNAGLYKDDQQFALQWIQRHISKFGGDPKKVTIWGESAGAGSIIQHVIANNGNTQPPLFRAAIASSPFLPPQYDFNHRIPEQIFEDVVDQAGCSTARDALECLRQVDAPTLNKVNVNISNSGFFGTCVFVPVVDGTLITKRPTELLRLGRVNGEVLLSVTTSAEGTLSVDNATADTITTPQYLKNLFPELSHDQITTGTAHYADLGTPIEQARFIMSESMFVCPAYFLLRGFRAKRFKGEFGILPAFHGDDIPYYFPHAIVDQTPPFNNTEFIDNFSQSFLNFVITMDPNIKWDPSNTLPQWPQWMEENPVEMLFNRTEMGMPIFELKKTSEHLQNRCAFWESISATIRQ